MIDNINDMHAPPDSEELPPVIKQRAAEDFSRARVKEVLFRIMHFMHTDRTKLLSLNDVKEILKPGNETYKGMEAVPISLIVGSEGRYRDFNKFFLPRYERLRSRWERVDEARLADIMLPPIQLYEIGGVYFVRDGNHRVSVAKTQGLETVDAEVTSLSTEIRISPSMTVDELRSALIRYEKEIFYKKTNFAALTSGCDLNFTMPGRFDVICDHILVHKYYLNQTRLEEISFEDALVSWYNKVYKPVAAIISEEKLCACFHGRTESDLYVWIVKHWELLKKKYGICYSLADAARDFRYKYGGGKTSLFTLIYSFFSRIFKRTRR
ncbi:MAG: transcriptional regulator [Treponema sp.]|nr:transcriptional regulator [Treponema sp.]